MSAFGFALACRPAPSEPDPAFRDVSIVQGLKPFFSEGKLDGKMGRVDHFEVPGYYQDLCDTMRRDPKHHWKETGVETFATFIAKRPSSEYSSIQVTINPGRNGIASGSKDAAGWSLVMVVRKS
jgi:hypothetical protein